MGHTRDYTSTITALSDNCSLCYGRKGSPGEKILTERERWTPDGGEGGWENNEQGCQSWHIINYLAANTFI